MKTLFGIGASLTGILIILVSVPLGMWHERAFETIHFNMDWETQSHIADYRTIGAIVLAAGLLVLVLNAFIRKL